MFAPPNTKGVNMDSHHRRHVIRAKGYLATIDSLSLTCYVNVEFCYLTNLLLIINYMSLFFPYNIITLLSSLVRTIVLMYHQILITNTKRTPCNLMPGQLKFWSKNWHSQLSLCSMVVQVAEVGKDAIGLRVSPLQFRWSTSKELSGHTFNY